MATFFFKYNWLEDGYGVVEHLVTISDSYEGLFDLENARLITNLNVDNIEKSCDKLVGGIIESKLTFNIHNHKSNNQDEVELYDLIMSAKNPDIKVFVAKFINAENNPNGDNIHFYGLVLSEFETDDLFWHGSNFSNSPNPIKVVKGTASPFSTSIVEKITLHDLINGNNNEQITGISTDWEDINVADRQSYFDWPEKLRSVKVRQLVSLNKLIRKIADNLTQTLINKGFGEINFVFEKSELDGVWHPARWVHSDNIYFDVSMSGPTVYPRFNYCKNSDFRYNGSINKDSEHIYSESTRGQAGYQTYSNDYNIMYIDPDGIENLEESFYINYRIVKNNADDPYKKENEEYLLSKKCKNFYDLLEKLAVNMGAYVVMEMINSNTVQIKFVKRSIFRNNNELFIRTPIKAGMKISSSLIDEKGDSYTIKANYLCDEGVTKSIEKVTPNISNKLYKSIEGNSKSSNTENLLFSIAPTTVIFKENVNPAYIPRDDGRTFSLVMFPLNTYLVYNGENQNAFYAESDTLHTALYVYTSKESTNLTHFSYFADEFSTPDNYFTPIGAVSCRIGNVNKTYYNISEFISNLLALDMNQLIYEYNIDIPAYFGFTNDVNDINLDWKLINFGSVISIDSQLYSVISIKWDASKPLVSLKLQSISKFDLSTPTNVVMSNLENNIESNIVTKISSKFLSGIAFENVKYLHAVTINNDIISVASASTFNFNAKFGIALNDSLEGDAVGYITNGSLTIPDDWDDLIQGKGIYLKYVDENRNISQDIPQPGNSLHEDLILQIGIAADKRTIELISGFNKRYTYSQDFWGAQD